MAAFILALQNLYRHANVGLGHFSLSDQMATQTCSTVRSRNIPKTGSFLTCSSVPPSACLYINPPSLPSLESHQHDSGRRFPVCWGRRRRGYFLRPAACWTQCSASAQSQEPREQRRRPLPSETWHKRTGLCLHALILKNHNIYMIFLFTSSLISALKKKENYYWYSQHIEMSVFCIIEPLIYCTEENMSFPSSAFSRA